jgi:asparagine synthase (glutamine-hydrolysing)
MSFRDRYWIVFNGEIYNYIELRQELRALGYAFRTETDTEVILAAYDAWGTECLRRFNGMWAFALLDTSAQTLFLARDRFGVKPLYVQVRHDRLAFASELKAFRPITARSPRANESRLLDFLVWNVSDHSSETLFAGCEQLSGGHCAVVELAAMGSESFRIRYSPKRWYAVDGAQAGTSNDQADALREALDDSVRLRLRADVAVGSCLSGGLDSSSIVCLASRQLRRNGATRALETFTASSLDAAFDETRYAKLVADRAGTHPHFVTPDPGQLFENLDSLIWHQDEPFLSTSIFAQWLVFRAAKERGAIVMLDGQGADEILGGYPGYFGAHLAGLFTTGKPAAWWRQSKSIHQQTGLGYRRLVGYTLAYAFPGSARLLGRLDRRDFSDTRWVQARHRGVFQRDALAERGGRARSIREMSIAQLTATHLPMLLHWEDRNSMAFSIEARVPFLDYRVVELCLGFSEAAKVGAGISKSILRRSMRGIVPDEVLDRRDKMGFVTAEPLWATRDRVDGFRSELASAREQLPSIFTDSISTSFDDVVAGRRPFDGRYWRAIALGRWARVFDVASE